MSLNEHDEAIELIKGTNLPETVPELLNEIISENVEENYEIILKSDLETVQEDEETVTVEDEKVIDFETGQYVHKAEEKTGKQTVEEKTNDSAEAEEDVTIPQGWASDNICGQILI